MRPAPILPPPARPASAAQAAQLAARACSPLRLLPAWCCSWRRRRLPASIVWQASRDLPDYERLAKYEPPVMTRIHANDGTLMAEYARERRIFVPINVVPKMVIHAFLAAEDRRFYEHGGLDFTGIGRAALQEFPELGQDAARGCLHHHPAGRQELPAVQQAGSRPQAEGGDPRHPHRARLLQGQDSRAVSQRDLSRHRLVRRRRRGAQLFRQGAGRARARGGGLSRRAAQGAQQLSPLPQGEGSHRPAQLDPRPDGRGRLHHAPSRQGPPRPSRSRSTSARSARRSMRPTTSPRRCGAGWSRCTARMASTAAPSAPAWATTVSTAASRCAPRSTPTCSASARRALIDGLVAFDRERGWRGARAEVSTSPATGAWRWAASKFRPTCSPGGSASCFRPTAARRRRPAPAPRSADGSLAAEREAVEIPFDEMKWAKMPGAARPRPSPTC